MARLFDDDLFGDRRIQHTYSTSGAFGLAFDPPRERLYVVEQSKNRVRVFSTSCAYGAQSVVNLAGEYLLPVHVAIDHDYERILVSEYGSKRVQVRSLRDHSFISFLGSESGIEVPRAVAIDRRRGRTIVADSAERLLVLASNNLEVLFAITSVTGNAIAIDHERDRLVVADSRNRRVQVLSSIDGSFLFEFGSYGHPPGQFQCLAGVCIDNQGRIIVADSGNRRLQAFTHEGRLISYFDCEFDDPSSVAFDEHRGLIAFTIDNRVNVIGANQWLANTEFKWRPDLHRYAPSWIKQAVSTMTMIRSVVDDSASMSMIPNELLFEIFSFL